MKKSALAIVAVFLAVVPLYMLQTHGGIYRAATKLRLVPQDEHFTEVYFPDAAVLPKIVTRKQPIAFSFVIHNQEGANAVYPYEIFVIEDGQQASLKKDWVALARGEATTEAFSFTPKGDFHEMTMYVNFPSVQEQLHFSVIEQQ
jgi:hypothetical protein